MKKTNLDNFLYIFFLTACICAMFIGMINKCGSDKENDDSFPVEEYVTIDSIKKDNSKLIIEVNNLDSIKDVKAIEVKTLDNDSTVKLFYKLIGK